MISDSIGHTTAKPASTVFAKEVLAGSSYNNCGSGNTAREKEKCMTMFKTMTVGSNEVLVKLRSTHT